MTGTTVNFGLDFLSPNQAQKDVTVNGAIATLDSFSQPSVISATVAAPPSSPGDQDKYIVPAAAAGAWAGRANTIAVYSGGTWTFYTPRNGWIVYDQENKTLLSWDNSAWNARAFAASIGAPSMMAPVNAMNYVTSPLDQAAIRNGNPMPNASAYLQAAANAAKAFPQGSRPALYIPGGRWPVRTTVDISGLTVLGDGNGTELVPLMTDGSPVLSVAANTQFFKLADFNIAGNADFAAYLAGTADGAPCTGIYFANPVNRWQIDNVNLYGLAVGANITGYIGETANFFFTCCDVGLIGDELNSVWLAAKFENCRKEFAITNSTCLEFPTLLIEGANVANSASTVDGCTAVGISSLYCESALRTAQYIIFGGTTQCRNVAVRGASLGGVLAPNADPLLFDRVDGLEAEFLAAPGDAVQQRGVGITSNTRNYHFSMGSNDTAGIPIQDNGGKLNKGLNYAPNSRFDLWFRGWGNAVANGATISKETTLTRTGPNALRITGVNGQTYNNVALYVTDPVQIAAMAGKYYKVAAWIWVPALPQFDIAQNPTLGVNRYGPGIVLQSYNGSAYGTGTTAVNTGFVAGAWNWIETNAVPFQTDASEFIVTILPNQTSLASTGAEYICVDSICVCEDGTPTRKMMSGDLIDSDLISCRAIGGRCELYGTGTPGTDLQVWGIGDRVINAAPASGQPKAWIATVAGSPGTWASEGNL